MVVDELARRHDGSWRAKFDGKLAEIRIDGHKVALLKPETYMNDSGRAVGVGHALLQARARTACSSCTTRATSRAGGCRPAAAAGWPGHNGLRSIAQRLGTPDFLRLRVGVGRPGAATRGRSPTTSSPTSSRTRTPRRSSRRAADAVETLDAEGLDAAQRKVNEKR